jgi:hypothetical protein
MAELPINPTTEPAPLPVPVIVETPPTDTTESKKATVCKKTFLQEDGTRSAHATPETVGLEFAFANDRTHVVKDDDFTPAINACFTWMGRSEKLGNGYAGAKKKTDKDGGELADNAEDMFLALYEQLGDGDWVKVGEGGGVRPSMLVDAIVAALIAEGEEVNDERRDLIALKLKADGEDVPEDVRQTADQKRKKALANPAINAEYERIKLAAQTARTNAAAAKAEESATPLTGF